jgi:hypothetical protein
VGEGRHGGRRHGRLTLIQMVWDRRRGDGASILPGRRPSVLRGSFNELGSSVTTYRFDPQLGSLQPTQSVPSIPPSYTGKNTGAEIAVAPPL